MRPIFVIASVLVLSGCYNEAIPLRDLTARYQTTTGHVLSSDCANHGTVYYKFEADGRLQAGRAPGGILDCSRVSVGDAVKVYYDPANPTVHTLKEPRLLYEEKRGFNIPVWLGVPLLFALLFVFQFLHAKFRDAQSPTSKASNDGKAARRD